MRTMCDVSATKQSMWRTCSRVICYIVGLLVSSATFADDCRVGAASPERVIASCSAIIDSSAASPDQRAHALIERALARRELLSPSQLDQYDYAILDIEQALEIRPRSGEAHHAYARIHQKVRRFEEAISEYDKALETDDGVADWWMGRGLANLGLNLATEAMRDFDRAMEAIPDKPDAYFGRAMAHFMLRDVPRGLAEMDRALAIDPTNADLLLTRAAARTAIHDFEGAIADYDKFIESHDAGPEAYFQRGLRFELLGDWERASADFGSAVRLGPEDSRYAAALARVSRAR